MIECEKIIYLDEQLPPVNETVVFVVVEVGHGESTKSKLRICYDFGGRYASGTWWTNNDWEEGQPWSIVGWLQLSSKNKMKRYIKYAPVPSEEEIRKHKIEWRNEKQSKINWISDWSEEQIKDYIKHM